MNYSIISYIIGMILKIEAIFMTLPAITALIYQETSGVAFLITIAHQEKTDKKGILHKRRFRNCSIKLDCSEYYGCNSLCDQPEHSESR